ncbi:Nucleotidylyl transferase [Wilcoxina mikolae CBS 423.85]|nr:Nucleotidylyl transferase [Wilcoxina mikolae CBS 423.85]
MPDERPEYPPKVAIPMDDNRIWIDGCFDFTHHGHAGAMLQAKRLGNYLCVGIHSDKEILENKGPTVMNLDERVLAVSACRWANLPVPTAPYVTDPEWMDRYGCRYVVHGDDVTTDASGEDCYRIVKSAGRFKIVKRTPGISTTDLVGRMLLCTKTHHIRDLAEELENDEEKREMMKNYASDAAGVVGNGPVVFEYSPASSSSRKLVDGVMPTEGRRIVYVDGGFDLFTPGHIEFLRLVVEASTIPGSPPPYVVAGIHSDRVINHWKGLNYPIMNIFERSMCVLQCRYIDSLILSAPFVPDGVFLDALGKTYGRKVEAVYHGPTAFMEGEEDTYEEAKARGIYKEVGGHRWQDVNAGVIVERILRERERYEERQRKKGVKATKEDEMVN